MQLTRTMEARVKYTTRREQVKYPLTRGLKLYHNELVEVKQAKEKARVSGILSSVDDDDGGGGWTTAEGGANCFIFMNSSPRRAIWRGPTSSPLSGIKMITSRIIRGIGKFTVGPFSFRGWPGFAV